MNERLPAGVEVAAIIRQVQSNGGFATVLHRGDADRGAISLIVTERGETVAVLQRRMTADFIYRWAIIPNGESPNSGDWRQWLEKQSRIDPDCWVVELDIADAQRFIAETTFVG